MALPSILSDLSDLVLGRSCVGCGTPAPGVCGPCLGRLRGRARAVTRPGVEPPAWAATEYAGLSRRLVLAYKRDGYRSLARPLGWLLADAVWAAACSEEGADGGRGVITLVPVPGHRHAPRGFDALAAVCREGQRALNGAGLPVTRTRLLRSASDYPALKGLDRGSRARQVAGAFQAVRTPEHPTSVVLVDDVITTGATLTEAVTTLERAGVRVSAVAAVAATASRGR